MAGPVVLVSLPGLREIDLELMPNLREATAAGELLSLTPSFPCVTCPVQAAMTTGATTAEHGITANGFYHHGPPDRVEMWTAPSTCFQQPRLWDVLADRDEPMTSAVWFPLHSKGLEATAVCTPAPIHNPDGSETLWCYTQPTELYGELRDRLGDFPLQHYWGPRTDVKASAWIVDSAVLAAASYRPDFFYIYPPHLDYAPQRNGPDSPEAKRALTEMDELLGRLIAGMRDAYGADPTWIFAGEYAITEVSDVTYPNRTLREAGLLAVGPDDEGCPIDLDRSEAFALVDHQFSYVYVRDRTPEAIERVASLFLGQQGIDEVLVGPDRDKYDLINDRTGQIVLISSADSWQAYYWWEEGGARPDFTSNVDIHRKPGYDPVELFWDKQAGGVPVDATLIAGSHGAPAHDPSQKTIALTSAPGIAPKGAESAGITDRDIFGMTLAALE